RMERGVFDWDSQTRAVRGSTAGILGFGGIGQACARLFASLGVRVRAINRSGHTTEPVDWIGSLDDLDSLLGASDFVVIALPLTRRTRSTSTCVPTRRFRPESTPGGRSRACTRSSRRTIPSWNCRT